MDLPATLLEIASGFWNVLGEMAPYLLFGFLVAGIFYVFITARLVERHLGGRGIGAVLKAAAFGVPLPLCSCGVIPVSASLRRHGASQGATTSFLIATPQSGVDSILVTLSLLGPVFAIFRPLTALAAGVAGGSLVNWLEPGDTSQPAGETDTDVSAPFPRETRSRPYRALHYGFVTLPADIGRSLLIGLVIAALITALVPPGYFAQHVPPGILQMLVMMAAGIPVYVCATASVPVAAALLGAGVSPGAALVFLMTGPATNAATLVTIARTMSVRTAVLYLLTVAGAALGSGLLLDAVYAAPGVEAAAGMPWMLPNWIGTTAAVVLLGVLVYAVLGRWIRARVPTEAREEQPAMPRTTLRISGMTCSHCAASVQRALAGCEGVEWAEVDLDRGEAVVGGTAPQPAHLRQAVEELGYEVRDGGDLREART